MHTHIVPLKSTHTALAKNPGKGGKLRYYVLEAHLSYNPSKHTHSIKAEANPGKGGKATLHMYLTLPCSAYHLWFSFCGQKTN